MTTLYSCKSEIDGDGASVHRITKFDASMNVESSYRLTSHWCECPAGERSTCRHRQMLPKFLARGAVNTFWLYDFDRDGWVMSEINEALELNSAEVERSDSQGKDIFAGLAAIPGVQVFNLAQVGPETIYNAIADVVGEPRLPPTPRIHRRGF